ncbi:MAG: choice-of-anchor D domain-containing protein [Nitrospirae bacterium]|nr:choice-of-anchor D domain-containing protein [Nitrospirota bacterium]
MKRQMVAGILILTIAMAFAGVAYAEEAGCFQSKDNWLIRVYSEGAGSPYSFTLAVIDPTTGGLLPHTVIKAFAGATAPCLNADRAATNLCRIESDAQKPDISLGCDSTAGTVHVVHDHAGQLMISTIPDIVRYLAATSALQVTPVSLDFGKIVKGKTLSLTVSNTGTADLHISSITPPNAPFSIVSNSCTNSTIAPATGSCGISINFDHASKGTYTDTINISSDGGNVTVQLTGSK